MILEGVSPVGWLLAAVAAAAYTVLALAARRIGPVHARRVMLLAWALHGALLVWDLLHGQPHFGFAQALGIKVSATGVDSNLVAPIPYVVTIISLVIFALNQRRKERRRYKAAV